jgi:26S proteasome regulatory subunit T5
MLIHWLAQILDMDPEAEEGATKDVDSSKKSKCAVIKTSTRQVRAGTLTRFTLLLTQP